MVADILALRIEMYQGPSILKEVERVVTWRLKDLSNKTNFVLAFSLSSKSKYLLPVILSIPRTKPNKELVDYYKCVFE